VQPYLYRQVENQQGVGIYVDDSHVTHGILFPGVNVFKDETHEVSIFKEKIAVCADPESRATAEEKDRLGAVFKEIWQELDVGKDGSGGEQREARFEVGSLKQLLTNPLTGRRLTGIVVRHKSEWSVGQAGKFEELKALIRKHKCAEEAERLGKRIADLGIALKGEGFDSEREAYYFHPLGMIGWLSVSSKKLIDRDYFFEQYKKHFTKLTNAQKDAIENIFTGIEEYIEADSSYICTLPKIAYMLATAKHETGHTFEPVTEKGSVSYFNRYDPILADTERRRKAAKDNGNINKGDGFKYRGRGYVQLTWYNNYKRAGSYLGKDLVNNPELALDQKDATKIMIYGMETGMFTGNKMSSYISNNKKDYLNARRIINGVGDEHNFKIAKDIELYAYKLEECLRWL
ncbi:glycoside hydrolase family 19 protein, partial [Aggregatibacter actinomycetemcomitans]|uniref:glycoside hydrolase family 19 protein n=2 Tax=Aggregatibacter actinomycetemcomitans TaxID=714 RepID=UPI001F1200CB